VRYASFVVRIWQPEDTDVSGGDLRGRIEHVQSGAVGRLAHLDDVIVFISEWLSSMEPDKEGVEENNNISASY
jgi:hypothetical protein